MENPICKDTNNIKINFALSSIWPKVEISQRHCKEAKEGGHLVKLIQKKFSFSCLKDSPRVRSLKFLEWVAKLYITESLPGANHCSINTPQCLMPAWIFHPIGGVWSMAWRYFHAVTYLPVFPQCPPAATCCSYILAPTPNWIYMHGLKHLLIWQYEVAKVSAPHN